MELDGFCVRTRVCVCVCLCVWVSPCGPARPVISEASFWSWSMSVCVSGYGPSWPQMRGPRRTDVCVFLHAFACVCNVCVK